MQVLARAKAIDVSLFPALIELLEVVNLPGWGPAMVLFGVGVGSNMFNIHPC